MSVSKRRDASEPLTEHDVAERYARALLRVWRITLELTDDPVLWAQVRHSRYLSVQPSQVTEALTELMRPHETHRAADRMPAAAGAARRRMGDGQR